MKGNFLRTAVDIAHVLEIPSLSVLDIQSNRITDVAILDILTQIPNLLYLQVFRQFTWWLTRRCLLQTNDVVKHIKQSRKLWLLDLKISISDDDQVLMTSDVAWRQIVLDSKREERQRWSELSALWRNYAQRQGRTRPVGEQRLRYAIEFLMVVKNVS